MPGELEGERRGRGSPVDEGWNTPTAVLNFGVLKIIQTPEFIELYLGFQSR